MTSYLCACRARAGLREKVPHVAAPKHSQATSEAGSRECSAHLTTSRGLPRLRDQWVGSGREDSGHKTSEGPVSHITDISPQGRLQTPLRVEVQSRVYVAWTKPLAG